MTDSVFALTHDLRDYYVRQTCIAPNQIRVISNGVDTERFAPRREDRTEFRGRFDFPKDAVVLGTVGRMVAIKGQYLLLRAAEALIRKGEKVFVLLVGSGPEQPAYERYVNGSSQLRGRESFAGESQQVPQLLNAKDVFTLPSFGEGMSNTLLEAMATGLPLVATSVGGNSDLVEEGRNGFLIPAGDLDVFTATLHRLVADHRLRSELGINARQKALGRFSLEQMLNSYRQLYWELAKRRGLLQAREGSFVGVRN